MQMIAIVVNRQHAPRVLGVAERLVEINHGIEGTAAPDPFVDGDTLGFALGRIGPGHKCLVLERRQRATKDLDTSRAGAHRHLGEPADHFLRRDNFLFEAATIADVVYAQHDNSVRDPRLGQHIPVEAFHAAVTTHVVQDASATKPLVHDPKHATATGDNASGELVGPAAEGIVGRDVTVCDRVAKGDDTSDARRGLDFDATEEIPVIDHAAREHHLLRGKIARWRNVAELAGIATSYTEACGQIVGDMEADGQILQRLHSELYGVADDECAGRDLCCRAAVESDGAVGAGAGCSYAPAT